MQKIMAINAGSSSLKFQIFQFPEEKVIVKGLVERIGIEDSAFHMDVNGEKIKEIRNIINHQEAIHILLDKLMEYKVIKDVAEITGVGHRVAHGGEVFVKPTVVTEEVIKGIEAVSQLAPLHNPSNLVGIKLFRELLPHAVSVAVFDTSFHQTIPAENYLYALPYELYEKHNIRKYGFHGTSHQYVSEKAAEAIYKDIKSLKIISCHLGNGSSICAIENGKSINTSMGFTPNAGLMMGTRSGTIDATIIPYLVNDLGYDINEVDAMMSKESGILGISGISSDLRDIEAAANDGDERAKLALNMFVSQIARYIGAYTADIGGLDILLFTAGIGENSRTVRKLVLEKLAGLGIIMDEEKNGQSATIISKDTSKVKVCVIPTNEELMIAREVDNHLPVYV